MKKNVTNLLSDISKARDIIQRADIDEINHKMIVFLRISNGVKTQLAKYIKNPDHELDFTHEDLNELSTEVFEYIKNFQQRFTYSRLKKDITSKIPVDNKRFQEFSMRIAKEFSVHSQLTGFYKEIAYSGLVIWLWSQTDDKKPFDVQITELIRSFI
jgi:hypothetical protein